LRKKKILLVDDDEQVQTMLENLLAMDYDCIPVQNGEQGLSYLGENVGEIDLVITDLSVPQVGGMGMLKSMGKEAAYRNIPVLIMASLDHMEEITNAFAIGVDDILSKPLNTEIVKHRVSNMLDVGKNRMVHNVMEDVIRSEIDEYIDSLGICTCPVCRRDLLTLTLNHVPPKYVTSEKGAAITKAERITSRDEKIKLLTEITYYAQMVKKRPNHG